MIQLGRQRLGKSQSLLYPKAGPNVEFFHVKPTVSSRDLLTLYRQNVRFVILNRGTR